MTNNERTTCLVVGGGPAGMVLGLLLARAGVEVTVLEKHADFLRDFRGDTVHASTLTLLDELGLGERFAALPHRRIDRMQVQLDSGTVQVADLQPAAGRRTSTSRWCPQWDLLDLLADAAEEEPTFTLRRNAEVIDLLWDGRPGRRRRATATATTGAEHELRASLTVACDGRGSAVRAAAGLRPRSFGVPMDVWWFRLPRHARRPGRRRRPVSDGPLLRDDRPRRLLAVRLPHPQGQRRRAAGGRDRGAPRAASPRCCRGWPTGSTRCASWDDVKLLDVRLDRLRRWDADGLLLIGDAAHAMSPGRRGGDQPGGAGRRGGGPGARARAGVGRHRAALGAAAGAAAALVADRPDPGRSAARPPRVLGRALAARRAGGAPAPTARPPG